jgi:hypothetical protein
MRMEVNILTLERNMKMVIVHVATEQSNDISLPLHKHLCLWSIKRIMYVEHVTNQLEFLPAQPGFYMLAGA